ncbi:MAG: CoA transferase [Comamonadaceae bacterium]|nr:MAG: CoA transferase [Comamonadaceae bacterium]
MEKIGETGKTSGTVRGAAERVTPQKGPLAGLRVIDITAVLMGPYCTQMLGDMGADVVKIEAPEGDIVRQIGPARNAGMGPIYLNANHSKRSVAIDLKHPQGRELMLKLLADADVLVYNVRPQAMERLGLSYEQVSAINPRIIYAGVFGYAQHGPYAARPAYDDLIQGAATLASLFSRSTGSPPQYVPSAIVDRVTGMSALGAILGAVIERTTSGLGQKIDIPMFETMVSFVLSDHMGGLTFDPPLDAGGYARQLSPNRRPYRTQDGYVCALIYTDKHWRNFFRVIGREADFDADPKFSNFEMRSRHVDAIYGELESILATRSTGEWLECLAAADIPAMPVHDLESIFDDEHLRETGFFTEEDHPTEGRLRSMKFASQWSRTQPAATRHAPRHGEHTAEVLAQAGVPQDDIDRLVTERVIRLAADVSQ